MEKNITQIPSKNPTLHDMFGENQPLDLRSKNLGDLRIWDIPFSRDPLNQVSK